MSWALFQVLCALCHYVTAQVGDVLLILQMRQCGSEEKPCFVDRFPRRFLSRRPFCPAETVHGGNRVPWPRWVLAGSSEAAELGFQQRAHGSGGTHKMVCERTFYALSV